MRGAAPAYDVTAASTQCDRSPTKPLIFVWGTVVFSGEKIY